MQMNPVGWFEIYVQDMNRAKTFYQAVLGHTLQPLPAPEGGSHPDVEMWAFPMLEGSPGATGSLVRMPGCPSGGSGVLIYFHCEDCAVQAARVATNGGSICREKISIGPYGFIALAMDTEGNMFGLHSMN